MSADGPAGGPSEGRPEGEDGPVAPRAEEVLVRVWKELLDARSAGRPLDRVVLTLAEFRRVRDWHARLGSLEDASMDYVGEDSLFGLPVFIRD